MKRTKERWYLIVIVLATLAIQVTAVAPFKKVSIMSTTTSTSTTSSTTATEAPTPAIEETKNENGTSSGPTKNSKLTGIPQIDYIWDPNLPRELRGYNLSSYPFFSTVPPDEDIHFKCDGLHDGFYASIEHKCQVYHHCVYGIRHDFLCANFTAFDQKTFICHFVSDVDCEGSEKYWNRNDALYMATTTTSTTTTTTEPPPTPRRRPVRPLRPLRRPVNRRPVDDYYYEDEEYDDDYYEERLNSRRKQQRPRQRKPQLEYEDEYDEKRSVADDEKPRRPNSRDRFRDSEPEVEDDYENDRRKLDRPKARNKANPPAERRKAGARRPVTLSGRSSVDERRSFSDEKPNTHNTRKEKLRPTTEETIDTPEIYSRHSGGAGRRRANEKRPTSTASSVVDADNLDYYEKPHPSSEHSQEEAVDAEEELPVKTKTTAKPLEEFITPKAIGASVFARPRAPPRIPRPVPINEKKKYEYPVQKSTAATANNDEEYEEYDDHSDHSDSLSRSHVSEGRRRNVDEIADDFPAAGRRRTPNETPFVGRKPSRTTLRKPLTDKKSHTATDEDYETSIERFDGRVSGARKRPHGRPRAAIRGGSEDVDFVDDEYDEQPQRPAHRLRPKTLTRKNQKKSRPTVDEEEDAYEPEPEVPNRHRLNLNRNIGHHRTVSNTKLRQPTATAAPLPEDDTKLETDVEEEAEAESPATPNKSHAASSGRPSSVRVVKRPFLPSRGGSPYLPRGLQPVGIAHRAIGGNIQTTDSTPIDMGSTISGVRLLEHGAPILRDSGKERNQFAEVGFSSPRTTLPPRSALPVVLHTRPEPQPHKATLDELYETDYDVTLNDALNPTLKPLPNHHHHLNRNYASAFASSAPSASNPFVNNNQSPAVYHNINNNNNNDNDNENNNDNDNYQHQHQNAYQTLSSHQPQSQASSSHQSHNQHQQHQSSSNNFNSDSYFSSTDIRRRAIIVPAPKTHSSRSTEYRGVGTRIAQHFYDDFDY